LLNWVKAENAMIVTASNASLVNIPRPQGFVAAHSASNVIEITLGVADAGLVAMIPFSTSLLVV